MDELRGALDTIPTDRPVLVDLGSVPHVRYTLLVELQRRGIDFRFAPGTTDLSRFGRERCDDGSAAWLLSLAGVPMRSASIVVAATSGCSPRFPGSVPAGSGARPSSPPSSVTPFVTAGWWCTTAP